LAQQKWVELPDCTNPAPATALKADLSNATYATCKINTSLTAPKGKTEAEKALESMTPKPEAL